MPDKEVPINFDAPATLRKWPSLNNERISASLGARPYLIIDGTLDQCIQKFMAMPLGQHHLYEIHTAAQSDLKRFPSDLNRRDSQRVRNERIWVH